MKNALLTLLAVAGLLAGCQQNRGEYALRLQDAHEALCSGSPDRAEVCLTDAGKIAAERKIEVTNDAKILQAEVHLANGDLPGALNSANEVLNDADAGEQDRARAEEVVGKAALRQGRFTEAQNHFVAAEKIYEAEDDRQRIADLIHLTRGLDSYSAGDVEVARKYWRSIQNAELRYSVDQVVQDARTASAQ